MEDAGYDTLEFEEEEEAEDGDGAYDENGTYYTAAEWDSWDMVLALDHEPEEQDEENEVVDAKSGEANASECQRGKFSLSQARTAVKAARSSRTPTPKRYPRGSASSAKQGPRKCFICDGEHLARHCPDRDKPRKGKGKGKGKRRGRGRGRSSAGMVATSFVAIPYPTTTYTDFTDFSPRAHMRPVYCSISDWTTWTHRLIDLHSEFLCLPRWRFGIAEGSESTPMPSSRSRNPPSGSRTSPPMCCSVRSQCAAYSLADFKRFEKEGIGRAKSSDQDQLDFIQTVDLVESGSITTLIPVSNDTTLDDMVNNTVDTSAKPEDQVSEDPCAVASSVQIVDSVEQCSSDSMQIALDDKHFEVNLDKVEVDCHKTCDAEPDERSVEKPAESLKRTKSPMLGMSQALGGDFPGLGSQDPVGLTKMRKRTVERKVRTLDACTANAESNDRSGSPDLMKIPGKAIAEKLIEF